MSGTSVTSVTALGTLDQNALITRYSQKLRRKMIASDLYVNLKAPEDVVYQRDNPIDIPDGVWFKMEAGVTAGANNIRVLMKMPINANVLTGRTVALGREVAPIVKSGALYRAPYRFVVQATPGYGPDKLDAEPWRLYEEHVTDLAPHGGAEEGLEIRQALVETHNHLLWNFADTSAVCPAQFNRNVFVVGAEPSAQPLFHPNAATYTNRIVGLMDTVSGGNGRFEQTASQMLTCGVLDKILRWAWKRVWPFMIDGRPSFVLSVSQLQADYITNPNNVDSLGSRWIQTAQLAEKVQNWYGIIGAYRAGNGATMYIVVDDRLPTLLPMGSGAPYSLTPGYVWPTDNDLRNLSNSKIRDACVLHGRNAYCKWEPEPSHLIADDYDYKLRNGKGYAGVRSIMQLQFDTTPVDPTGAAREYWGSALVIAGRLGG
jgi:hypothetical protein